MATGWVRSLQCKSNAIDDVYQPHPSKPPKKKPLLPLDCGNPSHALRDVVLLLPRPTPAPPPPPPTTSKPNPTPRKPKPKPRGRTKPKPKPRPPSTEASLLASPAPRDPHPISFPTLAELPAGHSSRRVVEIIFGSSWSRRGAPAPFPGEVELLFRVHHPPRAVARFEEYRAAVRARAAPDDARCAADGNEMMRFHSAPSAPAPGDAAAAFDAAGAACAVGAWGPKGACGIRTFAGSGGAHESAGGGAGRRAMLVCRVVAGRVRPESAPDPDGRFDSVSTAKAELLVFDPRAVLPCFLIIYQV